MQHLVITLLTTLLTTFSFFCIITDRHTYSLYTNKREREGEH